MRIDFEKQKPSDYRTDEENEAIRVKIKKLHEAKAKN